MRHRVRITATILVVAAISSVSAAAAHAAGDLLPRPPGFSLQQIDRFSVWLTADLGEGAIGVANAGVRSHPKFDSLHDVAIVRLNSRGKLVRGFGRGGVSQVARIGRRGERWIALDVLAESSGRAMVLVGLRSEGTGSKARSGFALVRFLANGRLDRSFGKRGVVMRRFRGVQRRFSASDLAALPDGRLIVCGSNPNTLPHRTSAFLRAFTDVGAVDQAFGTRGVARLAPLLNSCRRVTVDSAGGLLAAGLKARDPDPKTQYRSLAVTRVLRDGSIDATYGIGGLTVIDAMDRITPIGPTFRYNAQDVPALLAMPGGGSLVVGMAGQGVLARLDTLGQLVPGFGQGGIRDYRQFDPAGIVLQGDGRVLLTGDLFVHDETDDESSDFVVPAVGRLMPDGSNDASFSGNGYEVFRRAEGVLEPTLASGRFMIACCGYQRTRKKIKHLNRTEPYMVFSLRD